MDSVLDVSSPVPFSGQYVCMCVVDFMIVASSRCEACSDNLFLFFPLVVLPFIFIFNPFMNLWTICVSA